MSRTESESLGVLLRALSFAAEKHKHHRRKGADNVPYINHPIRVATLLATVGGVTDINVLTAAVLHDTVEDTDATPEELEREFGPVIAALVAEVTDDPSLSSAERKATQEREASFKSPNAKLIRIADKTCNVFDVANSPPPSWSLERRGEYFNWAGRVVAALQVQSAVLQAEFDAVLAQAREGVAAS